MSNPRYVAFVSVLVLAISVAGCNSQATNTDVPDRVISTSQPAPTAFVGIPNSNLLQADGESLEDFLARIAVVEFFYGQSKGLVVYSTVKDPHNLWFGVSTKHSDAKRCWLYQEQSVLSCSEQDIKKTLSVQPDAPPVPRVYFAIVTSDSSEMLVIFDIRDYQDSKDTTDGYRVVLSLEDGKWHEKSIQSVY